MDKKTCRVTHDRPSSASVTRPSPFDRPAASLRDRDADNLDRLAAGLYWLAYYCRGEPCVDEPRKHLGLEPMGDHEPITGSTERIAGKHF